MVDVFISYSREDADRVRPLQEALERFGLSTWLDRSVEQGADFEDAILEALTSSGVALVCWSEAAAKSKWVRREAREAERQGKYLGCQIAAGEPGFGFETINNANLSHWSGNRQDLIFLALVSEIGQRIGRAEIAALLGAEQKRIADEAQRLLNAEEDRQRELQIARQLEAARIHAIERRKAEERRRALEKALSLKDRFAGALRSYCLWLNPLVVPLVIDAFLVPTWARLRGVFSWLAAEFRYESQYRFTDVFGEGGLDDAIVSTIFFIALSYLFCLLIHRWLLRPNPSSLMLTVSAIMLQWIVYGWFVLAMMRT